MIEHPLFTEAVRFVSEIHYPVNGGAPSSGIIAALIGDSRCGKTFAVKKYCRGFPAQVGPEGLLMSVLYVDMPMEGGGGPRAILEAFAQALQLPSTLRVSNPVLQSRIMKSLMERGVTLLVLDEFEQVFRENDRRMLAFGRGLLRKLADLGSLTVVCVGLAPTYGLLRADAQLTGRGLLPRKVLEPYKWGRGEEQNAFRRICSLFDNELPFAERSGLSDVQIAERIYYCCDGYIGRLKALIEAAGALAINDGSDRIEISHFASAYEGRRELSVSFNPFLHDLRLAPSQGKTPMASVLKPGPASNAFSKATERGAFDGL